MGICVCVVCVCGVIRQCRRADKERKVLEEKLSESEVINLGC